MEQQELLKALNLTEDDFKLMVEGLEFLLEREATGNMVSDMLTSLVSDRTPEARAKNERERRERDRANAGKKEQLKEDVRILQGKLLQLKRFLLQQGALQQANTILNTTK